MADTVYSVHKRRAVCTANSEGECTANCIARSQRVCAIDASSAALIYECAARNVLGGLAAPLTCARLTAASTPSAASSCPASYPTGSGDHPRRVRSRAHANGAIVVQLSALLGAQ